MGPSPFSDGRCSTSPRWVGQKNCFNGAIAFQRWKAERERLITQAHLRLQWGHRLSAMEGSRFESQELQTSLAASMGPSPFSDGRPSSGRSRPPSTRSFNGAIAFQRWKVLAQLKRQIRNHPASMGPSPFSDGRFRYVSEVGRSPVLQWGHRLSAMEGRKRGPSESSVAKASMGPSPFSDGRHSRSRGLSIARVYRPVVARVNGPPCGPVDGVLPPLGLRVNHLLSVKQGPVG